MVIKNYNLKVNEYIDFKNNEGLDNTETVSDEEAPFLEIEVNTTRVFSYFFSHNYNKQSRITNNCN